MKHQYYSKAIICKILIVSTMTALKNEKFIDTIVFISIETIHQCI
jgi:hypothetical protein